MTAGADEAPPQLAGYQITRLIGVGGMGRVYLATRTTATMSGQRAIKIMTPAAPDGAARFRREVSILAGLDHPNIVRLFDSDQTPDGRLWMALEYVAGPDAASVLAQHGPVALPHAIDIVSDVAAALDYAYAHASIVHRDVKPANILIAPPAAGSRPQAKLADFGIAKLQQNSTSITQTGTALGTVAFMAPETLEGFDTGPLADVYSLGCTAYALLTGSAPFVEKTQTATITAHLTRRPDTITSRNSALPAGLDAVFAKVLAKAPNDRFSSAGAFASALRAAAAGQFDAPTAIAPHHFAAPTHAAEVSTTPAAAGPRRSRALAIGAGVVTAVLAATAGGAYLINRGQAPASALAAEDLMPSKEEIGKAFGGTPTGTTTAVAGTVATPTKGITPAQCAWFTNGRIPIAAGATDASHSQYLLEDAGAARMSQVHVVIARYPGALPTTTPPERGACESFTVAADAPGMNTTIGVGTARVDETVKGAVRTMIVSVPAPGGGLAPVTTVRALGTRGSTMVLVTTDRPTSQAAAASMAAEVLDRASS
ncbi:Serine/threonine-protein kinase pknF (plasmid) [Tsukamurella tyrosinosolvens]|uniref:non-specific serine/threonine protein kinase n=1 Tax=Tsukamurella tyrosinosolvens TaxID=57704 RepID=A0A1H4VKE3_TSUTY|nr:serine/threonine-protein kinase [Tsukamurella tyrosinosolvens]KXO90953.1 hypothetical protein AXK58_21200 [Tsukamurella tyrosinosolvens]SEC81433.1 serine/threonine protein kinase [Tsukamurella tyrosinosolvens]VEH90461.1 Serine/threonine-protein kinase pknF [Tsukamurella tyrosinosolvens]